MDTNKNEEEQKELQVPAIEEYKALFASGVQKYETREFEEASKIFQDTYKKFPEQVESLVNYGNCQYELLNTGTAVNAWQEAIKQDRFLMNPYINLGNYYLANQNYIDAIDQYTYAFCLEPHNESALVNLAISFEKMNNKRMAFLLYEFYLTGTLNVGTSNYKNIHKKVAMHKLNAIYHMKMGIYYERKGFYRKAIQSYYESLKVFPNFSKTYSNIGNIFYKLEKYEYAKSYWLEAYKADKKNLRISLNLALCCDKIEDSINAYSFYMNFIQGAKGNTPDVQRAQSSAMNLHEIIMANPDLVAEYRKKCEEFEQNGKYDDALVYYENLSKISSSTELTDKINKMQVESNLVHKASFINYEHAKDLFEKGNTELAMKKCKISMSLWKNSYLEASNMNIVSKCENILGNSINDIIIKKAKK